MRESIPAPLYLSLSGPAAVREATEAARLFAESAAIDPDDVSRVVIVVEELVANLYDHGGLQSGDEFAIQISLTDTEVTVVLFDPGRPFDPRVARLDEETPQRGGGAGLKLVRIWASHLDYEAGEDLNRLTLRLPRRASRKRE